MSEKPTLKDNQRQWDLLRYMRSDLLNAGLINETEYSELAVDHPAVKRLEDYDELREAAKLYFEWNESEYQKNESLSLRLRKALGL